MDRTIEMILPAAPNAAGPLVTSSACSRHKASLGCSPQMPVGASVGSSIDLGAQVVHSGRRQQIVRRRPPNRHVRGEVRPARFVPCGSGVLASPTPTMTMRRSAASPERRAGGMQFDLGLQGLAILTAMSLGFGLIAQVVGRAETRWLWLIAACGWFVGGLFMSEVVFATATTDEIQPIIDGLAFDEALLGGLIVGVLVTLVARYVTGSSPFHHRPNAA